MEAIPVVAAVIFAYKFLIVKRTHANHPDCDCPDRDEAWDKWEFPGGKVDPDESLESALHREILEELDIEVVVERVIHARINSYGSGAKYLVVYYLCFMAPNEYVPNSDTTAWVDAESVEAYECLPGTKEIIATFR